MRGVCDSCGKGYKGLPDADRTYACKVCDGEVRALPDGDGVASSECAECGAAIVEGAAFCDQCGAPLSDAGSEGGEDPGEDGGASRGPTTGRGVEEDPLVHQRQKAILRQALTAAKSIRVIYWIVVVLGAIGFALIALFSSALPDAGIYLAVAGAFLSLYVAGAIFVLRRPFFWTVLLASVHAASLAIDLLMGGFPGAVEIVILVLLGSALAPTARLNRLLREHPDLWEEYLEGVRMRTRQRAARRREVRSRQSEVREEFRGRVKKGDVAEGKTIDRALQRRRDARARGTRKILVFGGGTVGVIAVIAMVVWFVNRPQSLDSAMSGFLESWNTRRVAEVAEHFKEERRGRLERYLGKYLRERDLGDELPRMTEIESVRPGESNVMAALFDADEEPFIRVQFRREDKLWRVVGLGAP